MGGLKIVVAGCVAAQEGETLLRRVPELDLVLGPHHANRCLLLDATLPNSSINMHSCGCKLVLSLGSASCWFLLWGRSWALNHVQERL